METIDCAMAFVGGAIVAAALAIAWVNYRDKKN